MPDLTQGGFIAPALDGRGHCSDHPRQELLAIIAEGAKPPGSPMLGFKDRLTPADQTAPVACLETPWGCVAQRMCELHEKEFFGQAQ